MSEHPPRRPADADADAFVRTLHSTFNVPSDERHHHDHAIMGPGEARTGSRSPQVPASARACVQARLQVGPYSSLRGRGTVRRRGAHGSEPCVQ